MLPLRYWSVFALLALAAFATGLVIGGRNELARAPHDNLNAALWVHTAPEYRIASAQAFELAGVMAVRGLLDRTWTAAPEQAKTGGFEDKPPAVILDVDETVLSNTDFQTGLVRERAAFNYARWGDWVKRAEAGAMPGAAAFVQDMRNRGIDVFYVTNRDHENAEATIANLEARGFPVAGDGANLLSQKKRETWGSDKTTRRAHVAGTHRILLLIGDDLNDFVSGVRGDGATPGTRLARARDYADYWGTRWIALPNPQYGSWESALYGFDHSLGTAKKRERKYEWLTWTPPQPSEPRSAAAQ